MLTNTASILAVVIFLAFALLLSGGTRATAGGKGLSLFRAMFPSWRFFEELVEVPSLHYRLTIPGGEFGSWIDAMPKPEPHATTLVLNPEGNLFLACHGILQQLQHDIGELEPGAAEIFETSVSFQLTENLVRYRIARQETLSPGLRFQFRVSRALPGSPEGDAEVFVLSRTYEA